MGNKPQLSERWTAQLLHRCTPKELVVLIAVYGVEIIARRMGYARVADFVEQKGVSNA